MPEWRGEIYKVSMESGQAGETGALAEIDVPDYVQPQLDVLSPTA